MKSLINYYENYKNGPGLWKWKHYIPIYERHLAKFVGSNVNLLEIGIMAGGSIEMWKWWFGNKLQFYGVDVNGRCRRHASKNVDIFIGNQGDRQFWRDTLPKMNPLDIVIDDGSHNPDHQALTFEAVLPHMNPGGVYICEDIHTEQNAFNGYVDRLSRNLHSHQKGARGLEDIPPTSFQQQIDSLHIYPYLLVAEVRSDRLVLAAVKKGTDW